MTRKTTKTPITEAVRPSAHWSFLALPQEVDGNRINREALEVGAVAWDVGVRGETFSFANRESTQELLELTGKDVSLSGYSYELRFRRGGFVSDVSAQNGGAVQIAIPAIEFIVLLGEARSKLERVTVACYGDKEPK